MLIAWSTSAAKTTWGTEQFPVKNIRLPDSTTSIVRRGTCLWYSRRLCPGALPRVGTERPGRDQYRRRAGGRLCRRCLCPHLRPGGGLHYLLRGRVKDYEHHCPGLCREITGSDHQRSAGHSRTIQESATPPQGSGFRYPTQDFRAVDGGLNRDQ